MHYVVMMYKRILGTHSHIQRDFFFFNEYFVYFISFLCVSIKKLVAAIRRKKEKKKVTQKLQFNLTFILKE